jgi:DNA-binding transcriptional ArsR family regulator
MNVPSLITTIKKVESIGEILERGDCRADKVIMLAKDDEYAKKGEKKGYEVIRLTGDFHKILKEIKNVFDTEEDPFFVAGETELDIYVTYYLTQFQPLIPFYILEKGAPILLPKSSSGPFVSTKKKILEILDKKDNITSKYIQDYLNRSSPKTRRRKYSQSTVYHYLHELENMGLVDIEIKRNKKYSLNDRGTNFMELLD